MVVNFLFAVNGEENFCENIFKCDLNGEEVKGERVGEELEVNKEE